MHERKGSTPHHCSTRKSADVEIQRRTMTAAVMEGLDDYTVVKRFDDNGTFVA
jgi:hypothetical protein